MTTFTKVRFFKISSIDRLKELLKGNSSLEEKEIDKICNRNYKEITRSGKGHSLYVEIRIRKSELSKITCSYQDQ